MSLEISMMSLSRTWRQWWYFSSKKKKISKEENQVCLGGLAAEFIKLIMILS